MSVSQSKTYPVSRAQIFYGWYIVGAAFVVLGMAAGVASTFSVFFKPLVEEFNWSRTELSGAIAINLVLGGLVTPFWGNWTDRSGARLVVVIGASFAGLFLMLLAWITSLWQIYLLFSLEALFVSGMSLIPISVAISQWFRIKRGAAMGVALTGEGVGGLLMAPLSNYLIALTGWRNAYLIIAGMLWIVVIPVAALILRRSPKDLGLLPDGEIPLPKPEQFADEHKNESETKVDPIPLDEFTLKQAMAKPSFWLIAIAFFLPMMTGIGIVTHLVAMFTDMGISSQAASTWLGLLAALSIIGRFGFGYAADRFSVRGAFTVCYAIETLGICILLATPLLGIEALYAFVIVYGLTFGGGFALAPLIVGECFGLKAFGTIFGVLAIAGTTGGAVGPVLSGLIYDKTGSYSLAFIIFSVSAAIATVAISQARSQPNVPEIVPEL